MRIWLITFFLGLGLTATAQQVIYEGKVHEVTGKAIFQDGVDITSSLHTDERKSIYKTLKNQLKEEKNVEKAKKRQEKALKKAEKSQKKVEKTLKQKQKAQDKFNKATKKLEQNQDKYQKLKGRGKLSPNAEAKWLKKINGYKKDLDKATKKLQKA